MSYFDTFMLLSLLEDIFGGIKDLATSRDTARWFWGIAIVVIAVLSVAVVIVSLYT